MKTIIKSLILTVLIAGVLSTFHLYSQNLSYGVKAGVDLSNWGGKDIEDADLDINPGFHAGAFVETSPRNALSLESGLYVATKGFKSKELFEDMDLKMRSTSYYLDLPIYAKYNAPGGFNLFAGPQFSYLLNNKMTVEFAGEKEDEWSTEGANRFDIGAVAGVGYRFGDALSRNANYDFGLAKLGKDDDSKIYNRVIKVSLAYRIR
ncbi:MAG: PorT family protein [Balneolaceae bacterium]|nr:PorT family protein [Balneolaceae bacterium]